MFAWAPPLQARAHARPICRQRRPITHLWGRPCPPAASALLASPFCSGGRTRPVAALGPQFRQWARLQAQPDRGVPLARALGSHRGRPQPSAAILPSAASGPHSLWQPVSPSSSAPTAARGSRSGRQTAGHSLAAALSPPPLSPPPPARHGGRPLQRARPAAGLQQGRDQGGLPAQGDGTPPRHVRRADVMRRAAEPPSSRGAAAAPRLPAPLPLSHSRRAAAAARRHNNASEHVRAANDKAFKAGGGGQCGR